MLQICLRAFSVNNTFDVSPKEIYSDLLKQFSRQNDKVKLKYCLIFALGSAWTKTVI